MGGECFTPSVARHYLKFKSRAWDELVRVAIDYRRMQKDIFAAIIRRDKSITAYLVELEYPARSQL